MAAGAWSDARVKYEEVLRAGTSAEALFGLGTALWWLGETDESIRFQERAFVAFRTRGDMVEAALTAVSLCLLYRASLGNYAASRGWLARLARLVQDSELDQLTGWVALCRAVAANDANAPTEAEASAHRAASVARAALDVDLEFCALAELGTALVQDGRTEDGTAFLDEAMAGALGGEAVRPETVVFTACRTITSCSRVGDVQRVGQWIRAADDFTRRYGGLHLYTTCRVQHAAVLFGAGRWAEAEQELRKALRAGHSAERALYGEALATLAELRLAQGRLDEAAGLLSGFEDHVAATGVLAAVRRRTAPEEAAAILRHRLDTFGQPCLESFRLEELLSEVELEVGETGEAMTRARQLAERGASTDCELVAARGQRALGRALAASHDTLEARGHLQRALDGFLRLEMPFEAARTHLLLAGAMGQERASAIVHARAALACFDQLGAAHDVDHALAVLRSLGVTTARRGARSAGPLSKREEEVLELVAEGLSNQQIADRVFLSRKTVEHHVHSVLTKLGLNSRAAAAAYVARHQRHGSATD